MLAVIKAACLIFAAHCIHNNVSGDSQSWDDDEKHWVEKITETIVFIMQQPGNDKVLEIMLEPCSVGLVLSRRTAVSPLVSVLG